MRTLLATLTLTVCVSTAAQLEPGRVEVARTPAPQAHDQTEYALDTPAHPADWAMEEPGLHAAFGSTDELYLRCERPAPKRQRQAWTATAWRGERLNAQLLVWSPETLEQVRLTASHLTNATGQVIDRSRISLNLVRYVVSNLPYGARDFTCDVNNDAAYLMPDRLEPFERFDLPGQTVRPVWISCDIPITAPPGEYRGNVRINSLIHETVLPITLNVQAMTLPPPREWRFRLDLWQNPWVVASHFRVQPWSDEHQALLRKHLKSYADAGGKYITTYAVHSPWSDNSYVLEGAMIDWIKRADSSWAFDYRIFDQYVGLAMECGIDRAITVYTPLPWGHRFRYLDEASGNHVEATWPPDSETFRNVWTVFLEDLRKHLVQKGWLERTYLGINENPLAHTLAAVKVIQQHSKDWKITYAGDWHPELSPLLDDYSTVIGREPRRENVRSRSARGSTTTYYVCCNPPRPNTFVFSPPIESRYLGWHAAALGYDGFLRWAYDAWPADPARDARHRLWPAGDCFLIYPGGYSSLRFEKLREGLVDFEKLRILRELVSQSSNGAARSLMKELEAHLDGLPAESNYSKRDYDVPRLTEAVHKGGRLVQALSDELGPRPVVSSEKGGMVFPGESWAMATPESQGVDGVGLSAAVDYLSRALADHGGTSTLFIVRNGYVIHAGSDSDTEHQIYSATKSFTSTALGLLIQDGKASLDTLAKDLEPALAEHYPTVSLRHFATMTSGYDSVGGSYEFDAQGRGDSWSPGPPAPPIFPPGSKFRYWDDAMSQFGSVLTEAAGQPLDQLFKTRIADPIGMSRWRWTENDTPTGRVLSWQGGIWTSSRELARFGHLFLNRGNWNGRQLIGASWVDQATTVQVPATIPNDTPPRSRGSGVYGYNWWINGIKPDGQWLWPGAPPRTYYANGLHNNVCIVVPEWNLVVARTNGGRKDGAANTPPNVDEVWSGFFSRLAEAAGR